MKVNKSARLLPKAQPAVIEPWPRPGQMELLACKHYYSGVNNFNRVSHVRCVAVDIATLTVALLWHEQRRAVGGFSVQGFTGASQGEYVVIGCPEMFGCLSAFKNFAVALSGHDQRDMLRVHEQIAEAGLDGLLYIKSGALKTLKRAMAAVNVQKSWKLDEIRAAICKALGGHTVGETSVNAKGVFSITNWHAGTKTVRFNEVISVTAKKKTTCSLCRNVISEETDIHKFDCIEWDIPYADVAIDRHVCSASEQIAVLKNFLSEFHNPANAKSSLATQYILRHLTPTLTINRAVGGNFNWLHDVVAEEE